MHTFVMSTLSTIVDIFLFLHLRINNNLLTPMMDLLHSTIRIGLSLSLKVVALGMGPVRCGSLALSSLLSSRNRKPVSPKYTHYPPHPLVLSDP
jgi:hypothetical protein